MSSRQIQHNDYWSNEFDDSTSSTWTFAGGDGLERLSGPSRLTAVGRGAFTAELTRVQLDHVALEAFRASAHRSERSAAEITAWPTPLLSFILLAEGRLRVELTGASFELQPGEFVVLDSRDPVVLTAEVPVRMLRSVVGMEHIPEALQRRGATVPGPLQRTPLTESFIAFASTVLRTTASGQRARGEHLVSAVSDLQSAVLAEAQEQHGPTGPDGLRFRMEEYIEAHFRDPDLGPPAIAGAMGVSLRQAHNVFDDGDRTIARFIRDRRVAAVALELRDESQPAPLNRLAARYGFTSADTLTRAFRQRFDMTPSEYRDGGHRKLG